MDFSFFFQILKSFKAFHKAFDTKDIETFQVNKNKPPKEKRSSPRTDLDSIEIAHVTEEEADALKMRSFFDACPSSYCYGNFQLFINVVSF